MFLKTHKCGCPVVFNLVSIAMSRGKHSYCMLYLAANVTNFVFNLSKFEGCSCKFS